MMNPLRGPAADLIVSFVHQVGPLADEMTFCGGNAAQLLVTDPGAVRVRATDDLDVIVAITSRTAYERLRERLAEQGIAVDARDGAPVCRFLMPNGTPVDVMPTDGRIVDLETRWFNEAVTTAERVALEATSGDRVEVSLVSAPAFLALKWNAFEDRGEGDLLMSHDFEDVLTVIGGRPGIIEEVRAAPDDLRAYVAGRFRRLLSNPDLDAAIEDAIPDARRIRGVRERIQDRLLALSAL